MAVGCFLSRSWICLLVVTAVVLVCPTAAQAQSKFFGTSDALPRVALVIGNANYSRYNRRIADTPNAYNDATDISKALRQQGFEVITARDADIDDMRDAIDEFEEALERHQGNATALFYYAGHGLQIRGVNYLVPLAAQVRHSGDIQRNTVPITDITSVMSDVENRLNIIILDACRNNPFASVSNDQGWAKIDTKSVVNSYSGDDNLANGLLVAFATGPGDLAQDNTGGRNGLYTTHFLKHMNEPGLPLFDLFARVGGGVKKQSRGQQVSFVDSAITGEEPFCIAQGPCEQGMSATAKFSFAGVALALALVTVGYIVNRRQTAWTRGIDLKEMLMTDDALIEQLLKRSRFGDQQIVGYLKDVKAKRLLSLINNQQSLVLGRNSNCNVCIDDDVVSGEHLELGYDQEKQQFWIKDLDSTNGSWFGHGQELAAQRNTPVQSGQLFYLANQNHPLVIIEKK